MENLHLNIRINVIADHFLENLDYLIAVFYVLLFHFRFSVSLWILICMRNFCLSLFHAHFFTISPLSHTLENGRQPVHTKVHTHHHFRQLLIFACGVHCSRGAIRCFQLVLFEFRPTMRSVVFVLLKFDYFLWDF